MRQTFLSSQALPYLNFEVSYRYKFFFFIRNIDEINFLLTISLEAPRRCLNLLEILSVTAEDLPRNYNVGRESKNIQTR